MDTLIGLFHDGEKAQNALHKLQETGFSRNRINLLTQEGEVRRLLESYDRRSHFMTKSVWATAILGMIIAAPLSFIAGLIVCTTFNFGAWVWLVGPLILLMIAGVLGASFGYFFSADAMAGETCQYCQAVAAGGQLMAVLLEDRHGEVTAWGILEHAGATEIKVLEGLDRITFDSLAVPNTA